MLQKLLLIFLLSFGVGSVKAQVFDFVVDGSGNGDFTTIQGALNALPDNSEDRKLIFIRNGIYEEKLWVSAEKTNVSLIGENKVNVVISWNDYQGKDGMSGADSYTFLAEGDDLYMENITVKNSYGPGAQAVAIRTIGERQIFKNCRFLGNQDTYYAHKNRQYNYKCYVEGNTDFIYGDATCVFDSCTINSIPGGSYITAPADSKLITKLTTGDFYHGLLFRDSKITADEGVSDESVYLGRPWQPNASAVYITCELGDHIHPGGWSTWSGDNHLSSVFAEFENVSTNGSLVDTTRRVDWSYQLSELKANNLYDLPFFLRKRGVEWNPMPMVQALPFASNLSLDGDLLTWDAVEEASGYLVYSNGNCLGFTGNTEIQLQNTVRVDDIEVRSMTSTGALSDGVANVGTSVFDAEQEQKVNYQVKAGGIEFQTLSDVTVFNAKGILIDNQMGINSYSFRGLPHGLFIIRVFSDGAYDSLKVSR